MRREYRSVKVFVVAPQVQATLESAAQADQALAFGTRLTPNQQKGTAELRGAGVTRPWEFAAAGTLKVVRARWP